MNWAVMKILHAFQQEESGRCLKGGRCMDVRSDQEWVGEKK